LAEGKYFTLPYENKYRKLSPPTHTRCCPKFYELNDDLPATQAVGRRIFFEFLRTKPTLTTDELEIIWSIAELVAELCSAKQAQA
jgi:hypothetical protein